MVDGMAYVSMIELAHVLAGQSAFATLRAASPLRFSILPRSLLSLGVWVDLEEKERIIVQKEEISRLLPAPNQEPDTWFETTVEADPHTPTRQVVHTRVVQDDSHYGGSSVFSCSRTINARSSGWGSTPRRTLVIKSFLLHSPPPRPG